MILVVGRKLAQANNLKELIEFMDTPQVCTAGPGEWRQRLGDHKLEALFVGPDLSDGDVQVLLGDVGELYPNVPIVMMQAEGATAR